MMKKMIAHIGTMLFGNDIRFRAKRVMRDIDKLELSDLYGVEISRYRTISGTLLTHDTLLGNLTSILRVVDESSVEHIPKEFMLRGEQPPISLIGFVSTSNVVNMMWYEDIVTSIVLYNDIKQAMSDIEVTPIYRYNSTILHLYIIAMEEIIDILYNKLLSLG